MNNRLLLLFALILTFSCSLKTEKYDLAEIGKVPVIDILGRDIMIPDTVHKVLCVGPSSIRLVTYAGGASYICGVENLERLASDYPHRLAYPELTLKPAIGHGKDLRPQLIKELLPDVIFMSTADMNEADDLQAMTGIPVVTVESSNPGNNMNRFFASLRLIGSVLRTSAEVEELIEYVGSQLDDLAYRSQSDTSLDRPNVYVGGIPSKGIKALSSTDPDYAAFKFIKAVNVAAEYEAPSVSYVGRNVRLQQLIDLNPDVVFIDASGIPRVLDDLRRRSSLVKTMNAYRQKKIYVVWPDYSRHFNFEIMLINAWYAGTILYPDRFSDIDVMAKADEILAKFVGKPIARDLAEVWGPFRNLLD